MSINEIITTLNYNNNNLVTKEKKKKKSVEFYIDGSSPFLPPPLRARKYSFASFLN